MKTRASFITNSSSSNFVIAFDKTRFPDLEDNVSEWAADRYSHLKGNDVVLREYCIEDEEDFADMLDDLNLKYNVTEY